MGKHGGHSGKKKKKRTGEKSGEADPKQPKAADNSPRNYDRDTAIFISISQELKEEGNTLFQLRDLEGAMLNYEKALKLLPRNHIDVSYLRSNMAACYMQMGLDEYPQAIHECNLALEVTPKYSKALLKRARCYEALQRLDLAMRDANTVLNMEPNNIMAVEISERVRKALEENGVKEDSSDIKFPLDFVELPQVVTPQKRPKEKKKKKNNQTACQETKEVEEKAEVTVEEKKADDKLVIEEKITRTQEETLKKTVKLVFGEDIRWAQLPINCTLLQLREVICDRFPRCRAILVKYRDEEGDLVTITTNEELRLAETSVESQGSVRFYISEVSPEQDPFYKRFWNDEGANCTIEQNVVIENNTVLREREIKMSSCIDDWILQFAQLFMSHVGFESGSYLDLHELGMKLYSEAMEETVTSEEAQDLFKKAAEKFHEMAALALFYWGNVIMSRARKRIYFPDGSKEPFSELIKAAYDWVKREYVEAGQKYQTALDIKPDFYEGYLALGQLQFEQAKLSWYYAVSSNVDLTTWPCTEVLQLYNNAEENMKRGMQMWEESEQHRASELSSNVETLTQKMRLDGLIKDISADEAAEQTVNMRSHINILWGTMLYERSILEFKLGLPEWEDRLEVAVEKFELAGASETDIAVIVKNHCSSNNAREGLGFNIDEIVQAWNEMYEARKLQSGVPTSRLEPLLRRRVSKIYHVLEQT